MIVYSSMQSGLLTGKFTRERLANLSELIDLIMFHTQWLAPYGKYGAFFALIPYVYG